MGNKCGKKPSKATNNHNDHDPFQISANAIINPKNTNNLENQSNNSETKNIEKKNNELLFENSINNQISNKNNGISSIITSKNNEISTQNLQKTEVKTTINSLQKADDKNENLKVISKEKPLKTSKLPENEKKTEFSSSFASKTVDFQKIAENLEGKPQNITGLSLQKAQKLLEEPDDKNEKLKDISKEKPLKTSKLPENEKKPEFSGSFASKSIDFQKFAENLEGKPQNITGLAESFDFNVIISQNFVIEESKKDDFLVNSKEIYESKVHKFDIKKEEIDGNPALDEILFTSQRQNRVEEAKDSNFKKIFDENLVKTEVFEEFNEKLEEISEEKSERKSKEIFRGISKEKIIEGNFEKKSKEKFEEKPKTKGKIEEKSKVISKEIFTEKDEEKSKVISKEIFNEKDEEKSKEKISEISKEKTEILDKSNNNSQFSNENHKKNDILQINPAITNSKLSIKDTIFKEKSKEFFGKKPETEVFLQENQQIAPKKLEISSISYDEFQLNFSKFEEKSNVTISLEREILRNGKKLSISSKVFNIEKQIKPGNFNEKSNEKSKEKSMEKSNENSKEKSKEKSKENSKEKSKEKSNENSKEKSKFNGENHEIARDFSSLLNSEIYEEFEEFSDFSDEKSHFSNKIQIMTRNLQHKENPIFLIKPRNSLKNPIDFLEKPKENTLVSEKNVFSLRNLSNEREKILRKSVFNIKSTNYLKNLEKEQGNYNRDSMIFNVNYQKTDLNYKSQSETNGVFIAKKSSFI